MQQATCKNCGATFIGRPNQLHCTAACREAFKYAAKKRDGRYERGKARKREKYVPRPPRTPRPPSTCVASECERSAHARGLCRMHYRRWARANGLEHPPSDAWSDSRRDHWHRRRAATAGAEVSGRALLGDIIDRDGTTCAYCQVEVDMNLTWPDPMSKSIDHRVPLSRGGAHTLANTQLMHLICNMRKGARAEHASV